MADNERAPLLGPGNRPGHVAPSLEQPVTFSPSKAGRAVEDSVVPEASTIGRKIGWSSAYMLVISRVIGSGIFAMPGIILQDVGSPGLALTLWIVGAFVAWAGLAISIEFGAMLPRSGGIKVYLEYVYRRPRFLASTIIAVQAVLLGFTASNCIIFAKYTIFAAGVEPTDSTTKLLAVGLLTVITIIHGCFYKTGVFIQDLLGWVKLGLTAFMILTGIAVLFKKPQAASVWNDPWEETYWEWNGVSTAFFKILYSFAGLENINNVLNEVKNPVRTIKTVGPAGLLTAGVMYVLINLAYLSSVPLDQVKQGRELIAALFFEKLGLGRAVLPIAIALSSIGNVMVVTFSLARYNQEIARQGFFPWPNLLASNRPFNAPLGGLIVHYIPSVLVIILPPSSTVYSFLAEVEGYASQFFSLALAGGLLYLRRRKPEIYRPFRAWIPAVWLRILLSFFLIIAPLFPPAGRPGDGQFFYATYALVALGVIALGFLYWAVAIMAIPYFRGYRVEESAEVLQDGTTITKLIRKEV